MSTKTLIGIGLIFLFFIGGVFLGWNIKPIKSCPEIIDSVYVEGDTVWVSSDTTFVIKWKSLPAAQEPWIPRASSDIDTIVVSNQDTISVAVIVEYWQEQGVFDWYMEIEHRDFDFHKTDTLKVYLVEEVKIMVTNPWWVVSTIVATLLLALSLIFGG